MSYYSDQELKRIADALEKIVAALKKDDAPAKEAVVESEAELTKTCAGCRYCEPYFVYDAIYQAECRCTLYAKICEKACPQFERR